jgi:hypothetical protein
MFLRFFRSTSAPIILFIPFLGFLLWIHAFTSTPDTVFFFDKTQMPLFKFFADIFDIQSITAKAITFVLVITQGLLLVRLNTRFIFINNRTYLPALFFIMITSAIPDLQKLNPVIFSGFFLLLALEKIFESYGNSKLGYDYFVAAFYLSIGSLFYPFLAFFMLTIWICLGIFRPFNWREWLFTFIGFSLPIFFIFSYYYLLKDQPLRIITDIKAIFTYPYVSPEYSLPVILFLCFVLLLIILASQYILRTYQSKKIFPRKAFTVFLWLFINTIVIFLLINKASIELIYIAAIPVSYLLAHYFALIKSVFWGNIFVSVLLLLLLAIQTQAF